MVLCENNRIAPNPDVDVQRVCEWKEEYGTEIFVKAGEPWEIEEYFYTSFSELCC